MKPSSVAVFWRNISAVNKTNISGFTFFRKTFVYSFELLLFRFRPSCWIEDQAVADGAINV